MAIGRLSVPEGITFVPEHEDLIRLASIAVTAGHAELKLLEPGMHDVTPKIWTRNTYSHFVAVFDNGEGRYEMVPRSEAAGFIRSNELGRGEFQTGSRTEPVSATNPLVVIAGGHPTKRDVQVYNFIMHIAQ